MSTDDEASYDAIPDFGVLYDSVPAYATRRDVAFYVEEAVRGGGPVLELGCGTGRVLLPVARALAGAGGGACRVVGVDGSEAMLERCRAKLAAEGEGVRGCVSLARQDARAFELGERFALVTVPFRLLQHLTTVDDQLRCLDAVARHLRPGGRLAFDVFNPNFSALVADRRAEVEDTPEVPLLGGGRVRRAFRVPRVRWTEQVSEIELIYYVSRHSAGPVERYVQAFDMRWYVPAELRHLLERAGFRVEAVHGDFDRSPLTDGSPEQVVCATLAG